MDFSHYRHVATLSRSFTSSLGVTSHRSASACRHAVDFKRPL